jgi:DNA-binding MarR family transcriptional regulator
VGERSLPRPGSVTVRADQRGGDARKSSGSRLTLDNVGFLLAKASQRWNELLYERFVAAGFPEVRPAYGSLLIPLYEEDGLRQGELARRARLSKQTMTTMARALERDGLIERRVDPTDARATLIFLTQRANLLRPVSEEVLEQLDAQVASSLPARAHTSLKAALRQIAGLDRERVSPAGRLQPQKAPTVGAANARGRRAE